MFGPEVYFGGSWTRIVFWPSEYKSNVVRFMQREIESLQRQQRTFTHRLKLLKAVRTCAICYQNFPLEAT